MRFRKKPVEVEAVILNQRLIRDVLTQEALHTQPKWFVEAVADGYIRGNSTNNTLTIETLEGPLYATHADVLIRGIKGEIYPCRRDIFDATYEDATKEDEVDVFLREVRAEIQRARGLFPGDRLMTIALAEEFGELCKAVLDENKENVRKEAVQTACMAARVVLDGDGSVREWRNSRGLDPLYMILL